jgi:hypothetical protein
MCVIIPMDIYSAIIQLSSLFADMLCSHFAIIMHLYQLTVLVGETYFTDKIKSRGPGSLVVIVTAYGLYGPGINSQWSWDFTHLSRPALRPTQPPVQWYLVFPGGTVQPGRDADPSPSSSAEVKNRVELYLYSP